MTLSRIPAHLQPHLESFYTGKLVHKAATPLLQLAAIRTASPSETCEYPVPRVSTPTRSRTANLSPQRTMLIQEHHLPYLAKTRTRLARRTPTTRKTTQPRPSTR